MSPYSHLVQTEPTIQLPQNSILIMYDPDAPNPPYLHWIVDNERTIVPYQGPSPPSGQTHHYMFELYRTSGQSIPSVKGGPGFQKEAFINGLTLIGQTQFTFRSSI